MIANRKENTLSTYITAPASYEERVRDYVIYLQNARERERATLAAQIHDNIAQNLLALRIDIAMLHARTQNTHPLINNKTEILLREIDATIQNTKGIINRLHPPVFALGLIASLEWEINECNRSGVMHCDLKINSKEEAFDRYKAHTIPVVRMLHETLRKALHHGQTKRMSVSLTAKKTALLVQITDDHVSAHLENENPNHAFGLIGIREYTRMHGGEFSIAANTPGGTKLSLSLPAIKRGTENKKGVTQCDACS